MQTEKIKVNSKGKGLAKVLNETERFASEQGYEKKYALHLRLLAEESLNMLRSLTGSFQGEFWLYYDHSGQGRRRPRKKERTDGSFKIR